jgi:uncharacterized protein with von Willebrand factor type A (vWA) domain
VNRAVDVDRWDLADLEQARTVPAFAEHRALMAEQLAPWGADALDDVFFLLFKARPELTPVESVERTHVIGHVLVSLLSLNPTVRRLQASTRRDVVAAASAAAKLAPQLVASAQEISCPGEEAALEAALAGEDREEAELRLEDLEDQVREQAETSLTELEEAASQAAEAEEGLATAAATWGLEPGELRRLPVDERLALAAKLDTPHIRQVTDLFGRLRTALFAERAELAVGIEPVDTELGGDLSRMVGSELLSLLTDDLFFARIGEGALAHYALRGEGPLGRGGIVLCVDGSWSMNEPCQGYTRELWASALKLLLLQAAVREDRPLHVIDFGANDRELTYNRFVDPDERTTAHILDTASIWCGGGTSFVGPLRKAIQVLADEGDGDADVVFLSDGDCPVSDRVQDVYRRGARSRGARTWGVQIGPRPGGLTRFCDEIFTISDLLSGRQLGDLLNAVESPRAS